MQEIEKTSGLIKHVYDYNNSILLNEVDVVAMTSTGAVKYKQLLQHIKSEILIVEEAGELLESQLITSLTYSIKHLILIGDH